MMDVFTREDLRELIVPEREICVSLYMPAHRTGREIREDALRFKNLLNAADEQLRNAGLRTPEARDILEPGWRLHTDSIFWQNQSSGLALFAAPGFFQRFRVPISFNELAFTGHRFHIKPILSLLQGDGQFFILAVSQKHVRFFQATHYSLSELDPQGLPRGLVDALNIDEYVESLQQHSFTSFGVGAAGSNYGMFHGQGGSNLDVKKRDELLEYFVRINDGLKAFFGEERYPLVFAGVEYLFPIFREACTHNGLMDRPVGGNPDEASVDQLHHKAWDVVRPVFERGQQAALHRYLQAESTANPLASHHLEDIIPAARQGRVETLFVAKDHQLWGTVDEQTDQCTRTDQAAPGTVDLLDYAAAHTLLHRGSVYALKAEHMPEGHQVAALYRFSVNPPTSLPGVSQ